MMQGYKTIFVNMGVVFMTISDFIVNNGDIVNALFANNPQIAVAAIAVANMVLRVTTTTPVFEGRKDA
jgi:hypothetical protein